MIEDAPRAYMRGEEAAVGRRQLRAMLDRWSAQDTAWMKTRRSSSPCAKCTATVTSSTPRSDSAASLLAFATPFELLLNRYLEARKVTGRVRAEALNVPVSATCLDPCPDFFCEIEVKTLAVLGREVRKPQFDFSSHPQQSFTPREQVASDGCLVGIRSTPGARTGTRPRRWR